MGRTMPTMPSARETKPRVVNRILVFLVCGFMWLMVVSFQMVLVEMVFEILMIG
jgi:hypothetical protein